MEIPEGKIISYITLPEAGYPENQKFYIISIPTEIEPLLEIRTWETISQDSEGPIGALRENFINFDSNNKKISQSGYTYSITEDDEPSPEQVLAALEKSANDLVHKTLYFKEPKKESRPKKYFHSKKKKV